MEFWITVIGLLRRKLVIIPAIVIAGMLGAAAYVSTPVTYVSTNTMVLTTTEFGGTESQDPTSPPQLTNPMLNFNDSLRTTSAILIESMNTDDVEAALRIAGRTKLIVNDGRTNPNLLGLNGPFLYIVGQSTTPERAQEVVRQARELMGQKLRAWQNALRAPEKTYLSIIDVVPPTAAKADRGRATKLALFGFLFGFVSTVGVAYLCLRLLSGRRRRAEQQPLADAAASTPASVTVPMPTPMSLGDRDVRRKGRRSAEPPLRDDEDDLLPVVRAEVRMGSRKR